MIVLIPSSILRSQNIPNEILQDGNDANFSENVVSILIYPKTPPKKRPYVLGSAIANSVCVFLLFEPIFCFKNRSNNIVTE